MMRRLHDHFPALFRFTLGGTAVVSWYTAITDPYSAWHRISTTENGNTLLWLMGIIGVVIVLDVVINDWTPDSVRLGHKRLRLVWQRAFKYRHFLFAGLSYCYAAQPYVAKAAGYGVSLVATFYWFALVNLACAFLDANQRSRSVTWQRACS